MCGAGKKKPFYNRDYSELRREGKERGKEIRRMIYYLLLFLRPPLVKKKGKEDRRSNAFFCLNGGKKKLGTHFYPVSSKGEGGEEPKICLGEKKGNVSLCPIPSLH